MRSWTDDRKLSESMKKRNIAHYTVPRTKYEYTTITWNEYMRNVYDGYVTTRSSIIPVTTIESKTYWLLGSFHDYPRYICMDFGGNCVMKEGRETNRQSPFGCAITELYEESKGLLTQTILKSIGVLDLTQLHIYVGRTKDSKIVDSVRPNPSERKTVQKNIGEKVFFFFVPVDYEEVKGIINVFNNTPDVDEKLGPIDLYSETDIFSRKILTTHHLTDFVNNLTD
jgi:hypothetical protein